MSAKKIDYDEADQLNQNTDQRDSIIYGDTYRNKRSATFKVGQEVNIATITCTISFSIYLACCLYRSYFTALLKLWLHVK